MSLLDFPQSPVEQLEICATKQSVVSQIKKKEGFVLADEVSALDLSGELRLQYEVPNENEEENDVYESLFGSTWVSHFDYCGASLLVDACVQHNLTFLSDSGDSLFTSSPSHTCPNPLSASSEAIGLAEHIDRDRGIEALKLSNNQIDLQGAQLLMRLMPTIRKLDLSSNELHDEGAIALFDAARTSTSLRTLILCSNQLTEACAPALAALLALSTPLRTLYLDHNSLGRAGVAAIVKALASNTTLEKLGLRANKIGDEGMKMISDFLMQQRRLTRSTEHPHKYCPLHTLLLGYNGITDAGVPSITALVASARLRKLFIDGNRIEAKGVYDLFEAVRQGRFLVSLSLVDTFSAFQSLEGQIPTMEFISDAVSELVFLEHVEIGGVVLYDQTYISTVAENEDGELEMQTDEDEVSILTMTLTSSLSRVRKRVELNRTLAKYSQATCALFSLSSVIGVPQDVTRLIMLLLYSCDVK